MLDICKIENHISPNALCVVYLRHNILLNSKTKKENFTLFTFSCLYLNTLILSDLLFYYSPFSRSQALHLLHQQQQVQKRLISLLQQAKPALPTLSTTLSGSALSTDSKIYDPRKRIYVGSLDYGVTEDLIRENFQVFGDIVKIDYPRDLGTGMTKGFCFIEFASEGSAQSALKTMDSFVIAGRQIKVREPQAGISQLGRAGPGLAGTSLAYPGAPSTTSPAPSADANKVIYVGSIPYTVPEDKIREIFEPFGMIKNINMVMNPETGLHKGFGFVTFAEEASAVAAISTMNGQSFQGRTIQVNYSNSCRAGPVAPTSTFAPASTLALPGSFGNIHNPDVLGASHGSTFPPGLEPGQDAMTTAAVTAAATATAMNNHTVSLGSDVTADTTPLPSTGIDAVISLTPTPIIVLQNLISAEDYALEDPKEFEREISEECLLYGTVGRVVVFVTSDMDGTQPQKVRDEEDKGHGKPFSSSVDIYVSYMQKSSAEEAQKHLDKRPFGDSIVDAKFVSKEQFQYVLETIADRAVKQQQQQ